MKHNNIPMLGLLAIKFLTLLLIHAIDSQRLPIVLDTQVYIIDVERLEQHELYTDRELENYHRSFLPNSTLDSGMPRLLYSYRHVLSGFAARLTLGELETVKSKRGFLYAQPESHHQLETTYTPRYLGLTRINAWGSTMMGGGLIIGVIDSGIKRSHPSFEDRNIAPAPRPPRWKGSCSYKGFHCSDKVIGGKAFYRGTNPSPEDTDGHGTHVASIAAGNFVPNANVLKMANGEASGMAPMAHLSIYKVCHGKKGCGGADILAAIEQAINDGVDIISMSISGGHNATFYQDMVARGSLAAVQSGIVAVCSAGNAGPRTMTLSHSAPWLLAVGASTTDRRIAAAVELRNGKMLVGQSAYQPRTWNASKQWPLQYPGINGNVSARCCLPAALANFNLRGKIVLCELCLINAEEKGEAARQAGAEGMILLSQPAQRRTTASPAHVIPAANVDYPATLEILNYFYSNRRNASAAIRFDSTQFGFAPSPAVASFSSRGPSRMNGGIIKPDVLAPGVNILAAWPRDVGLIPNPLATHTFNFESGTSMAAPYVAGTAALVKSKHRGWKPSEVLSAIVTSANDTWNAAGDLVADEGNQFSAAGIYASGAGEVNPIRAMDPGLVFGLSLNDYVGYMCQLGYQDWEITTTVGKKMSCSGAKYQTASQLNYPSIAVNLTRSATRQVVNRTAKNVGNAREDYTATIKEPPGVNVYLSAYTLRFTRANQEVSYDVEFKLSGAFPARGSDMIRRGKIVWDSGKHVVTTPVAVRFA